MDWTKYAKGGGATPKRVTITMTPQLAKAINGFKEAYPEEKFTDTAVVQTLVEAGLRVWIASMQSQAEQFEEAEE